MRNCVTLCTSVYYDVMVELGYVHVLVTWYYLWFSSLHRMWLLAGYLPTAWFLELLNNRQYVQYLLVIINTGINGV